MQSSPSWLPANSRSGLLDVRGLLFEPTVYGGGYSCNAEMFTVGSAAVFYVILPSRWFRLPFRQQDGGGETGTA